MIYALVFLLLASYLGVLALLLRPWGLLLLWPALSWALVAIAYFGAGPGLFGKRADGRLAWWSYLLLGPYLLVAWSVWHLQRRSRGASCEVAPGLWLGRRPLAHEVPAGVELVVDLTAEFFAPRGVKNGRAYRCLPTLDGTAPPERELRALVAELAAWPGPIYVHCAMGHGRSALVVAAVLLARGLAASPREAIAHLKSLRPGVRLRRPQRRLLELLAVGAVRETQLS